MNQKDLQMSNEKCLLNTPVFEWSFCKKNRIEKPALEERFSILIHLRQQLFSSPDNDLLHNQIGFHHHILLSDLSISI